MYERCGKLPTALLLRGMCRFIMHWSNKSHVCMVQTAQRNNHFVTVYTVANCRQHRAAENRLRHRVLHKNPSFPWADPSLFCINANYIILSGMQIRLDEAMADHLYRSILHRFQIRKNGTFQHTHFNISCLIIKSALNSWCNTFNTILKVHLTTLCTCTLQCICSSIVYNIRFLCLQTWLLMERIHEFWSLAVVKTQFA